MSYYCVQLGHSRYEQLLNHLRFTNSDKVQYKVIYIDFIIFSNVWVVT